MPPAREKQSWQSSLSAYFDLEYHARPLPARESLSHEQEWQCRILGGAIYNWLQKYGGPLLREREMLRESMNVESEPIIVLTANMPGLVAACEILAQKPDSIFYFSPEAFQLFLETNPDKGFCWHVEYTNILEESLSEKNLSRAAEQFPIKDAERYWLHREVSTLGRLFARGGEHLWKWDGEKPVLLEEGFNMWVS